MTSDVNKTPALKTKTKTKTPTLNTNARPIHHIANIRATFMGSLVCKNPLLTI